MTLAVALLIGTAGTRVSSSERTVMAQRNVGVVGGGSCGRRRAGIYGVSGDSLNGITDAMRATKRMR
jgi:hypothetical protein